MVNLIQSAMDGKQLLSSPTSGAVAKCVLLLNASYNEHIERWKLASYLNMSEDYLSRIFRAQMGISLWEYLARLRVSHAIDLLRTTGASLAEIADRTGFNDETYFCRVFKKITKANSGSFSYWLFT